MNLAQICQDAIAIVKETGAFLKHEVEAFDKANIEYKGAANNLVSYVDKEAEKQLVVKLTALVPEAGFITEEGTVTKHSDTLNWIIDPLDGTTNFIHGLRIFCVSVALVQGDQPLVGIVYEPNLDECFYAWHGGGAYCNGQPIKTSSAEALEHSLISTGFPYSLAGKVTTHLSVLQDFVLKSHGIRRLGAAAVDLAYVACGRVEGFYEYNLKSWDMAAGVLLVTEAGGKVTDFSGGSGFLFGGQLVAAAANIHAPMRELIYARWSQADV
jgi:myo-inositol-1(or 4)-monophosphatase